MRTRAGLLIIVIGLSACTTGSSKEPGASARAVGIQTYSIIENAERLTIEGLDERGDALVRLDLVRGEFVVDDLEHLGAVQARRLVVGVREGESTHTSLIEDHVRLPLPRPVDLTGAFLHDPVVAAALSRRHVAFDLPVDVEPPDLTEVPFLPPGYISTCSGQSPFTLKSTYQSPNGSNAYACTFSGCMGNPNQCIMFDAGTFGGNTQKGEYRCCNSGSPLIAAERRCTVPNGGTSCGTAGGGGCKVCWSASYGLGSGYCSAGPTYPQGGSSHMEYCGEFI